MSFPRDRIRALSQKSFCVILSDMCPLVSGITTTDLAISFELGTQALDIAIGRVASAMLEDYLEGSVTCSNEIDDNGILQKGVHLVTKLLESEDGQELSQIRKPLFRKAS